jgi:hypothetical protein
LRKSLKPGVCRRFGYYGKELKRNERHDEEPGKVCEKKKTMNVEKTKMMVFNRKQEE